MEEHLKSCYRRFLFRFLQLYSPPPSIVLFTSTLFHPSIPSLHSPPPFPSSIFLLPHSSPIPPNCCYSHHMQYFNDFSYSHSHILHVQVYIVPTMLTQLLYPLQYGYTPLHWAAREGHTICVECLLSTPGIDVYITDKVSINDN